jgi:hypothetical protein
MNHAVGRTRLLTRPETRGYRSPYHEADESTVRFEVSRYVGENLIAGRKLTIDPRHSQTGRRIRSHRASVYALVEDTQHGVVALRIKRVLPPGGALAQIGGLQAEEVAEVLSADSGRGIELLCDVGLEFDVRALGAIEKFEVADQGSLRKDVLQVPDLAPAIVDGLFGCSR